MIGATQAGVAGLVSPLVGILGGDAVALALVILGSLLAATLVLALATPAYRHPAATPGWHQPSPPRRTQTEN